MTKVSIQLAVRQEAILADIPDFNAEEFAKSLNGQILFIELGGNIINRGLIHMITPIKETDAE